MKEWKMTDQDNRIVRDNILETLIRHAKFHDHAPEDIVKKIFEHESAVQFDDKRSEAGQYIRGLIAERLDQEDAVS